MESQNGHFYSSFASRNPSPAPAGGVIPEDIPEDSSVLHNPGLVVTGTYCFPVLHQFSTVGMEDEV